MKYWLFKTEPEKFSIDDLAMSPGKKTFWNGVRNYQARNYLRDEVKKGDKVLLYHSASKPSGIAGICDVARSGYPDLTALDPKDDYYDAKSTAGEPRWVMVDIQLKMKFPKMLPLGDLRKVKALEGMVLLQRGSRLSIQPVTERQFKTILLLSQCKTDKV